MSDCNATVHDRDVPPAGITSPTRDLILRCERGGLEGRASGIAVMP